MSIKFVKEIISSIEEVVKLLGFNVQKWDYKMKLQGDKYGRKGYFLVVIEVGCVLMLRSYSIFSFGKCVVVKL